MSDAYVGRSTTGGNFATGANWDDVTTSQDPATTPPGSDEDATIAATGPLTATGAVSQLTLSSTGTLALTKATLSASDIALSSGAVRLNAGTTLPASAGDRMEGRRWLGDRLAGPAAPLLPNRRVIFTTAERPPGSR